MTEPIDMISIGAGVQSSTMALMAAKGEIVPMPKCGIFADTQAEPKSVYIWLDWLEKQLPFPIHRVTAGNLWKASVKKRINQKTLKPYYKTLIPAFVATVKGRGMLNRKCTWDFKMVPIVREAKRQASAEVREWRAEMRENRRTSKILAGAFSGAGTPQIPEPVIIQWIGISTDEASRMKPSRDPLIKHRWPLIEHDFSRKDCLEWMKEKGFPTPPKSACVFCPYHHDKLWREMKFNQPEEFARAVQYEKEFQVACADGGADNKPFLHSSLLPLSEVDFSIKPEMQINLFNNECEGMCGV